MPPTTPPTARFGAQRFGPTRKVREVLDDESAPTLRAEGWIDDEHTQIRWAIFKDSGVTSYSLDVYTWVEAFNKAGTSLIGGWVLVDTEIGITDDHLYYQYTDGCPCAIRVYTTVGAFADQFTILATGLNRP